MRELAAAFPALRELLAAELEDSLFLLPRRDELLAFSLAPKPTVQVL